MKLSIVSTLYRSGPYLRSFYERASAAALRLTPDYEFVFVVDGCPDDSLSKALALHKEDPRIIVVDLSRNFGHHRAMMVGLNQAQGDLIFLIDCDLEEEPEWLHPFHEKLLQGPVDVVYGVQSARKGDWFERCSGAIFYSLFNLFSSIRLVPNAVTARLMTRRYVRSLLTHRERELFIPGVWQITGYRQVSVPITKHAKGSSTYSFAKKIALLVNAITSFSDRPLVYIFYTGGLISFAAALYILKLLFLAFYFNIPVPGWASLIVSVWFLGGLTIFFIGVLGLYLSKIYIESKDRPYGIIRDLYGRD